MQKKYIANSFLFEILCEDLPANDSQLFIKSFSLFLRNELLKQNISFSKIEEYISSKRIGIYVNGLPDRQSSIKIKKIGPNLKIAYDENNCLTKAGLGFLKSNNIKENNLKKIKNDNGETHIYFIKNKIGIKTEKLLPDLITNCIKKVNLINPMKWGGSNIEFIRPIKSIILLYNSKIINCKILGINPSNKTIGNQYNANNFLQIDSAENYIEILKNTGFVIPEYNNRKNIIKLSAKKMLIDQGYTPIISEKLLEELAIMTEFPRCYIGCFNKKYLKIPREIIIHTIQAQQKCFPVINSKNKIGPFFIIVSDCFDSDKNKRIIAGYELMVNSRLKDSEFFYKKDLNKSLIENLEKLKAFIFLPKYGSYFNLTKKLIKISRWLSSRISRTNINNSIKAACFSKLDLTTEIVKEFPELQGTAGKYYLKKYKYPKVIYNAIEEQYLPITMNSDNLPKSKVGQILALSEKFNYLISIYSAYNKPSGDKDPYGLRRAALSIIKILINKKININLKELIGYIIEIYDGLINHDLVNDVFEFIIQRYKHWLAENDFEIEYFNAVNKKGIYDIYEMYLKINLLKKFCSSHTHSNNIISLNKRISNFLKCYDTTILEIIENKHFDKKNLTTEESNIIKKINKYHELFNKNLFNKNKSYKTRIFLTKISNLKKPLFRYFDKNIINSDNEIVKNNRIKLLLKLNKLINLVADIKYLKLINN